MKHDARLHRVYRFREPTPLTVELHEPDCECHACAPWLAPADAAPPALTPIQIANRIAAGIVVGHAIMFAYDPHGTWHALVAMLTGGR